jgi:hypothetical protein
MVHHAILAKLDHPKRYIKLAGALCWGVWVSGCAPVLPWERGILAKDAMQLEPYPLKSSLLAHQYSSREAASGGGEASGGGCGCY